MPVLNILINGRTHQIACDEGQEEHLLSLATEIDDRVRDLASRTGPTNESMMFLLTMLTMADELFEIKGEINDLKSEIRTAARALQDDQQAEVELAISRTIEEIATRVEKIADQIENG